MESKKAYAEQYVKVLDDALKGLFDESRESEIIDADKAALGDDYPAFEAAITAAYNKVEEARDSLKEFVSSL